MKERIRISKSGRTYRRSNASPRCREQHVTHDGVKISLVGRNGFDWDVVISKYCEQVKVISFPSRKGAVDEYRKMIKSYKLMNGY